MANPSHGWKESKKERANYLNRKFLIISDFQKPIYVELSEDATIEDVTRKFFEMSADSRNLVSTENVIT